MSKSEYLPTPFVLHVPSGSYPEPLPDVPAELLLDYNHSKRGKLLWEWLFGKPQHCWHEKSGTRMVRSGQNYSRTMICCQCGLEAYQEWKSITVAVEGHGPYLSTRETTWRPDLPATECQAQKRMTGE